MLILFFFIVVQAWDSVALDCFSTTTPGGRVQCNNVEFCLSYRSYDGSEWRGCDNLGDCLRDIMRPHANRIEQYTCATLNGKKMCCCNTPYCNSSPGTIMMHPSLVISSECTRMHVIMESDQCTLKITDDRKALIFESKSADHLSKVAIELTDNEGIEILAPLTVRLHGDGIHETVRIDAILQLIFPPDEEIEITSERFLSWVGEYRQDCKKYLMRVSVEFSPRSSTVVEESIAPIFTASLTIDEAIVPVSKELLATYSSYFETIFYQEFAEKQKGVYEIKEVDDAEFRKFIEYIHERARDKRKFTTAEQTIVALSYADRFGFNGIHEKAFAFLKTQSLANDELKEMFSVCSRFKNNDHMIAWILNQYKAEDELLELIHDCVPFVPANVIQSALKACANLTMMGKRYFQTLKSIGNRSKEALEKLRKEAREGFQLNIAVVHLRCYDEKGTMESERYFKLGLDVSKDFHWVRHLWPEIPTQYCIAEIDGERNARDNGAWFKVKVPKIVEVEAYKL